MPQDLTFNCKLHLFGTSSSALCLGRGQAGSKCKQYLLKKQKVNYTLGKQSKHGLDKPSEDID